MEEAKDIAGYIKNTEAMKRIKGISDRLMKTTPELTKCNKLARMHLI
jgi:hypothetical protein